MLELPAVLEGEKRRTCRVKDDSLAPVVMRGQRIVLSLDDLPQEGMIVAALKDDTCALGYYERQGKQYILRPPNPEYPAVEVDESWTILGFIGAKLPFATASRGRLEWDFDQGIRE